MSSLTDVIVLLAQSAVASTNDLLISFTGQLGLDEAPMSTGNRQANGYTWVIHSIDVEGVVRDFALTASNGTALIVILRSTADERDELFEAVFLPAVDWWLTIAE